ncbi:Cytokine-inducible SH2-containing protein [Larimichthys crocea]|uniref:Uncharacterized protein n=1 Tax=Larimichthys crocea TaxID=215358 RepID=A0ACD3RKB1_LARCR|nr:Cytokine-inducible SH2-containing protein [Larimichthys crocea]
MRAGTVPPTPCLQSTPSLWDPTKDLWAIASNFCYLENSGWYWGAVTATQAHAALQEASEGAFLVRDSSHPLYMLTLSVRTARGPTSIRIQYSGSQFLLRLQLPGPAQSVVLPQCAQPGAALHGTTEESRGGEGGGGGSFKTHSTDNPGDICGVKTEAGRVQAPGPPLLTAPYTARH